jgi:DtxR family Mn-dependent transcriptional regulator
MSHENREDYLRAIFCSQEKGDKKVQSVNVAEYLQISKPAVSAMLKKLKRDKLIKMAPYSEIILTAKGLKEAKKITFKHRITETFLKETLGFENNRVHREAHKIEHALSDEVAQSLATLLKNPKFCPCGHPIPKVFLKKGK